jgi:GH24 family phage-related lysozyme (muramidase)
LNQQIVLERLKSFEGCVPYMYRCTGGDVTAGIGHALLTSADAASLKWEISGRPASPEEIAGDFEKVSGAPIGLVAAHYAALTACRLPDDYLASLATADIERFEGDLAKMLPQWSSYSEPAQEGLFDMAFNLGIAGLHKFPRFLEAVEAQNWEIAAAECHRQGISEVRNQEVASLFHQAESLAQKA